MIHPLLFVTHARLVVLILLLALIQAHTVLIVSRENILTRKVASFVTIAQGVLFLGPQVLHFVRFASQDHLTTSLA